MSNFFRVLGMVGWLAADIGEAAKDGVITMDEMMGLMRKICDTLNIKVQINVPNEEEV